MKCSSRVISALVAMGLAGSFPGEAYSSPGEIPSPRLERKERKRYCKILERQLKADVRIGANGNVGVFGLGGRYELNYPNDLSNRYLAAHSDLVFSCRRWQRGAIPTSAFEEVRERYIAVYMAGTDEEDDARNSELLKEVMSSVSRFGFSDERRAALDGEFKAIRAKIAEGEAAQLSRSDAMLQALKDAADRDDAVAQRIEARLSTIERHLSPQRMEPLGLECTQTLHVRFLAGSANLLASDPALDQALRCSRAGAAADITGYADLSTGSPRENLRLSGERAAAVARDFTARGGRLGRIEFLGGTNRFGSSPADNRIVTIRVRSQGDQTLNQ